VFPFTVTYTPVVPVTTPGTSGTAAVQLIALLQLPATAMPKNEK
jgi:hypothetical protein